MIKNPNINTANGSYQRPILRAEIEEAQSNTNSHAAAARWLNVPYPRYKRYAQLYHLWEHHLNTKGTGIDKGFSKRPTSIPLKDILAGKHPEYSTRKLKNRLLARKLLAQQCNLCGFNEARITDNKLPLILSYKDNDPTNKALENLEILCYNCMFLTTGAPQAAYRGKLLSRIHANDPTLQLDSTLADAYDPTDTALYDIELTEAERQALYVSS